MARVAVKPTQAAEKANTQTTVKDEIEQQIAAAKKEQYALTVANEAQKAAAAQQKAQPTTTTQQTTQIPQLAVGQRTTQTEKVEASGATPRDADETTGNDLLSINFLPGGSGGAYRSTLAAGGSSAPSGPKLSSYVQDQSSYLEQLYAAKKAASLAALESAYKQNVAAIDRAGEGLEESYQSARNQTAGASELAAREFAEYAAAAGLNNGTAGQAELARGVTLQNNMNSLNAQEAQSIADLELQRSNAEIEYNSAIAQAEAQGNYELASALYQEKVRVQNALLNAEMQEYQNALSEYSLNYQAQRDAVSDSQWQQSFDQSVAQQNWANNFAQMQYDDTLLQQQWQNDLTMQQYQNTLAQQQLQNALTAQKYQDSQAQAQKETLASYGQAFLQSGVMPSADMLAAMGITSADAQAYINAANGVQPVFEETPVVEPVQPEAVEGPGFSTVVVDGMKASEWNYVLNNIKTNLRTGNADAAAKYLDMVYRSMNAAQRAEAQRLLMQYGYQYEPEV